VSEWYPDSGSGRSPVAAVHLVSVSLLFDHSDTAVLPAGALIVACQSLRLFACIFPVSPDARLTFWFPV